MPRRNNAVLFALESQVSKAKNEEIEAREALAQKMAARQQAVDCLHAYEMAVAKKQKARIKKVPDKQEVA